MVQAVELLVYAIITFCVGMVPFGFCIICCREIRLEAEERRNRAALAAWMAAAAAPPVLNQKLEHFTYSAAVEGSGMVASGERLCAICLEAFVHGATCSQVPRCQHFFHRDCIDLWMRSKNTCPMCRDAVVPGSEPLSAAEDMV